MSAVSSAEVIDLISDLVRIESVTPWLVEGGAGRQRLPATWPNGCPTFPSKL